MSSSFAQFSRSYGRGGGLEMKNDRDRARRCGGSGKDKIDYLGRLLTHILRHQASKLNLNMQNGGFIKVQDLLALNLKTLANIPLKGHNIDDVREAVRKDNKKRFSLEDENGDCSYMQTKDTR